MDLKSIEAKLKQQLADLEKKRVKIEEKLKALEVVKRAAEEIDDNSELLEEPELFEEEEEEEEEEEAVAQPVARPQRAPANLSEETVTLTVEDAVLEVIRTFNEAMKPGKIAEELAAVGYPFGDNDATEIVEEALDHMQKDGRIRKMKTIKGTFYGLPDE